MPICASRWWRGASLMHWLLAFLLVISFIDITSCFDEESRLSKLKKLINKKIKFYINKQHRSVNWEEESVGEDKKSANDNRHSSFFYIHELTLSDYVDYVLNKSEDYDCVLFLVDVENSNGISRFDRKSLVLLELFNNVAKKLTLENILLYDEGRDIELGSTLGVATPKRGKGTPEPVLTKPVFFFYLNIRKHNMTPLKYVHELHSLPEFVYVTKGTFNNSQYHYKIEGVYMLENYIKNERRKKGPYDVDQQTGWKTERQIERKTEQEEELSHEMIFKFFLQFVYLHNMGKEDKGQKNILEGAEVLSQCNSSNESIQNLLFNLLLLPPGQVLPKVTASARRKGANPVPLRCCAAAQVHSWPLHKYSTYFTPITVSHCIVFSHYFSLFPTLSLNYERK
ncbi:conserved Plasmodium membrane protein, unknown function [Plasmodium ovale wallikeri]|uniref:Uncharacterized protein n=1 Tax=Plasmodium ovale wallikeri TaxID=864142 RepID=A0A1A8YI97_PLAOA|nr:conserved Plasmodium membrane protein, unknown function [Plasmodium ovale wallikeri]SBT31273.1 conserved Plasmodium membrane protein, unknown function [Plasmodium ovale wallikeri]